MNFSWAHYAAAAAAISCRVAPADNYSRGATRSQMRASERRLPCRRVCVNEWQRQMCLAISERSFHRASKWLWIRQLAVVAAAGVAGRPTRPPWGALHRWSQAAATTAFQSVDSMTWSATKTTWRTAEQASDIASQCRGGRAAGRRCRGLGRPSPAACRRPRVMTARHELLHDAHIHNIVS